MASSGSQGYVTADVADEEGLTKNVLSGTKFRKALRAGEDIPEWCILYVPPPPPPHHHCHTLLFFNASPRLRLSDKQRTLSVCHSEPTLSIAASMGMQWKIRSGGHEMLRREASSYALDQALH